MIKNKSFKREQPVLKDRDRICTVCKNDYKAISYLQKTCGKKCRKVLYGKNQKRFKLKNPNSMKKYNKNRLEKNPDVWKNKWKNGRLEILKLLGGKCIVCNVDNINWLHIDYIPTMRRTGYRHPRHKKWMIKNIKDFRILCANHHYELTITSKIKGTNITQ